MAGKKRSAPRRAGRPRPAAAAAPGTRFGARARAATVAAVALIVHLAALLGDPLRASPISAFFFGDSVRFLEAGRHLAAGEPWNAGLPFHPPLVGWATSLLWLALDTPAAVYLAAKVAMAAILAAGYALLYVLLRDRLPQAFWICLLMPLGFGELLLSSAVNSEAVYRLLLIAILLTGWRRPWLAGGLNGVAALVRAEHLPFALAVAAALALVPRRRRFALTALGAGLLVLVPYAVFTHRALEDYNRRHAEALPAPLPTLVPVSFYGPLNFALAQREEDIFFSRRTLPPPPGGLDVLDPRYPPHHQAIVHGYRLGLRAIAERPGRFLRRTAAKLRFSLQAVGQGFTWRDLPDAPRRWIRPPVDVAYAGGWPYLLVALALIGLGAWTLRAERALLLIGALLIAYRLAVNAAFFPYLRGMAIVAPFWICLLMSGLGTVLAAVAGAAARRRGLAALVLGLLAFQLATATRSHRYTLDGERDRQGTIIDDRAVEITLHPGRR